MKFRCKTLHVSSFIRQSFSSNQNVLGLHAHSRKRDQPQHFYAFLLHEYGMTSTRRRTFGLDYVAEVPEGDASLEKLTGVNKGFWSHLWCSKRNATIFNSQNIFQLGCTRGNNQKNALISVLRLDFRRSLVQRGFLPRTAGDNLQFQVTQDSVLSNFQTPRSSLKIPRSALYFQLSSGCLKVW